MTKNNPFKNLFLCFLVVFSILEVAAQQGTVSIKQDGKIPKLLELKKEMEKDNKLTDAFTIQLYYGNLSKANSVLSNYRSKHVKWPASIEYETPNYKAWVGNFNSRLEADRALMEIHKNFPTAFVLRPGKNKREDDDK